MTDNGKSDYHLSKRVTTHPLSTQCHSSYRYWLIHNMHAKSCKTGVIKDGVNLDAYDCIVHKNLYSNRLVPIMYVCHTFRIFSGAS